MKRPSIILICLLALPLVILIDEILWRCCRVGDGPILFSLGYHTLNLESAVAACFYFAGIILYIAETKRKKGA